MIVISDLLKILNEIAPFELAEEWDNVGLLVGNTNKCIHSILLGVDLTHGLIQEAICNKADMIITHHPILFTARKNLVEDDFEGSCITELIKNDISLIALHTNLDAAPNGTSDTLARLLDLQNVSIASPYVRIGYVTPIDARDYSLFLREKLDCCPLKYGSGTIRRVAVCSGAGGDMWKIAYNNGADTFVTGEIKYHDLIQAVGSGLVIFSVGHYESERVIVSQLNISLQKVLNVVKYNVTIYETKYNPFT